MPNTAAPSDRQTPRRPLFRTARAAARRGLERLLGVHLFHLYRYPPRPMRVPDWYSDTACRICDLTISIVTPSYNQAHFLPHTLDSVLGQGYPKLEYIVQDGGSTDGTAAVLQRYRGRLHHCESRRDKGQAHALNLGFRHARGDILAFLNSDDLLLPGSLHYVADYFARHPEVDAVYGHRVLIDGNGDEVNRWVLPHHDGRSLTWMDYVPQETLFWRRSLWEKAGAAMDESFQFALDWDLLLRFRDAGARFRRLPRFLGAFRLHESQKTETHMNDWWAAETRRLCERYGTRTAYWKVLPYFVRQGWYQRMYQLGVLRY